MAAAEALTRGGFQAFVTTCDDRAFADLTPAEVMEHLPNYHWHKVLFLVDAVTIRHPEHPLAQTRTASCVSTEPPYQRQAPRRPAPAPLASTPRPRRRPTSPAPAVRSGRSSRSRW
ncbi:DUF6924 domain-containing protein [Catenulispora yoronensis]